MLAILRRCPRGRAHPARRAGAAGRCGRTRRTGSGPRGRRPTGWWASGTARDDDDAGAGLRLAGPARRAAHRRAGPAGAVSGVDEDAVLAGSPRPPAEDRIRALAEAKADAVARRLIAGQLPDVPATTTWS